MQSLVICVLPCVMATLSTSAARAQDLIYPAYPQPPAPSFYGQSWPMVGGFSPYGYGGYGWGGAGYGGLGYGGLGYGGLGYGGFGYGGFGYGLGWGNGLGYGWGGAGYYPLNTFGNLSWLPPNRPSPYYVTPTPAQYLETVRRREQAVYTELLLGQNPRP